MKRRSLLAFTLGASLALSAAAQAAQSNPLVGIWATQVNWNTPGGLYFTLGFTGNQLHERVMNHNGMAYDLLGTYSFDGKTMVYKWKSYAPKQLCIGNGPCQAVKAPEPIGVSHTSKIQFQSANSFVGTSSDGVTMQWTRTIGLGRV
jgi:hypothetical protein